MSNATNYFENLIANVFRGSNITGITPYLALFNGNPGEAGTGATEITTTIRVAGRLSIAFGAPSNGIITNSSLVDYGLSAGNVTLAGFGIMDAASGGNMLAYGPIGSIGILAGDSVQFPVGNINVTVA